MSSLSFSIRPSSYSAHSNPMFLDASARRCLDVRPSLELGTRNVRLTLWRDQMARERGRCDPQLEALADGEDISFGVFEPGGFCAAGGGDAVGHLHAGHVVLFEFHAA